MEINWIALKIFGCVDLVACSVLQWNNVSLSQVDVILVNISRKRVGLASLDAARCESGHIEHIAPGASWEVE